MPRSPVARQLLITEDDAALLAMLCCEFEELGYRVTATGCCAEALEAVAVRRFDLALLDYNLPDGVGTELAQALHRHQPELSVVLYSGLGSEGRALEARQCGACRFVRKPVGARELHDIFDTVLSGR